MQIVAYGAQDIYLTGSPQITYWKTVFRRHTNFAIESIVQSFNGTVGFGKRVNTTITRNGDLITDIFLEIRLKRDTSRGPTYYPAEAVIQDIELEIGGQRVDKHYSDWFRIYDSLFRKDDEREQYQRLTDFHPEDANGLERIFYLPLIFFFNRSPGLALPMIALQYHEVRLWINFAPSSNIPGIKENDDNIRVDCWVDYVFLDNEERRRFAQVSHEYLIQQLQFNGDETVELKTSDKSNKTQKITFNHPCKYLAWVVRRPDRHGHYISMGTDATSTSRSNLHLANIKYNETLGPMLDAQLVLNGHERFAKREGSYFNSVVPWQAARSRTPAGVYMYSFALKPDEHQPSGTCNFSRIDNAELRMTFKQASASNVASVNNPVQCTSDGASLTQLKVYAENYNVFRIMSGMGGLAYSN